MYVSIIPILLYLCAVTAQSGWEYNTFARATDGQPCISNCKYNKCISDWNGSTKPCWTNNQASPKYLTANVMDKQSEYCLSNCGFFGYAYQWCLTTNQKGWDYCNAEKTAVSVFKKPCTSKCRKMSAEYYWCFVDGNKDWQYCAPPREGLDENKESGSESEEFELDIRGADDKGSVVNVY
ncbi:hypothetical protein O0L34_g14608 [Tuta absoluta]|nr:hypothetical protein O0L34_g14608 [Tuta absoluta]